MYQHVAIGARFQGEGRPRRCLLKGCERFFRPGCSQSRYCGSACRAEAHRWRLWRASQRWRDKESGKSCRREQSRRYRARVRERLSIAGLAAASSAALPPSDSPLATAPAASASIVQPAALRAASVPVPAPVTVSVVTAVSALPSAVPSPLAVADSSPASCLPQSSLADSSLSVSVSGESVAAGGSAVPCATGLELPCQGESGTSGANTAGIDGWREGQRPARFTGLGGINCCDRPGCYVLYPPSIRCREQKFCSSCCRLALRRVRQRESRWRWRHGSGQRSPSAVGQPRVRGP